MRYSFVQGDTAAILQVTCKNSVGNVPLDLTGYTVKLRWRNRLGAMVEKAMSIIDPPTNGVAQYQFAANELEPPTMYFDVLVTDASGKVLTGLDKIAERVREKLA